MVEKIPARKLVYICKDIISSLEGYIEKYPDQEVLFSVSDENSNPRTNVLTIDIVGKGHTLSRPINFREYLPVENNSSPIIGRN